MAILAAASAIVIEALHGHECTGDGCVLCLVATLASGLLILCVGIVVVQPIILALAHARPAQSRKLLADATCKMLPFGFAAAFKAATPLSLGVMLRI
ncbi:MAG: hypothetical protein K6G78_03030 [bacterium]|nr:hypothetical protein [bacterium]